jgi:hypothetical protein
MALLEMEPVETDEATDEPAEWTWKPEIKDPAKLADALRMSSQTSRKTSSTQTDYGEGK